MFRRLLVALAAVVAVGSASTPTAAQERDSGEISVHAHAGPGTPADPTIQLFRDGGTDDLWPTNCAPAAEPGYTTCSELPTGRYTFGVTGVPDGVLVAPSCTFQSINGEFYPVNVGSAADNPSGAWDWAWACELFVGEPGVVISPGLDEFPPPTALIDGDPATCESSELHEGSTVQWCSAPTPGDWTIVPPAEVTDAGYSVGPRCEPIGTYLTAGYPITELTFSNTVEDPMWRCGLDYVRSALVWYLVAEPGSPEAALVDAPWTVVDDETGEDVSSSCVTAPPQGLGELVAYECAVPPGVYSVAIEGFDVEFGLGECTDVLVQDVTYCSVLGVIETTIASTLSTWSAPGETWPEDLILELIGGPADAAPDCEVLYDDVFTDTDTAVQRERGVECTRLLPGTYSVVVSGAPAGASQEAFDCDEITIDVGGSLACYIEIRTVDPPEEPVEEPVEEPLGEPVSTLPPTGATREAGTALLATLALLAGATMVLAARRTR